MQSMRVMFLFSIKNDLIAVLYLTSRRRQYDLSKT